MNRIVRRAVRTLGATTAAAALLVLGSGVASAHVTVDPSSTTAGGYTVLTFSVPHGCDGSATTAVDIQIPDEINSVTPTVNPNWDVQKKMVKLATPIDDGHGGQLTGRVGEVVYTAKTPLADGLRDTFALSLKLPATVGETLRFPVVQTCEKGEAAWIQVAAAGEPEPELPAPSFVLTAADSAAGGSTTSDSDGVGTVTWIALALGALGLLTGGAALLRRRSAS